MSKLPKNIQDEIIEILLALKPREIWLFGSYGSGNPTSSSDVDIFVVKKRLKKNLHEKIVKVRDRLNEFTRKYHIEVDLFIDTKEGIEEKIAINDPFYTSAFRGAIKIYDSKIDGEISQPKYTRYEIFKLLIKSLFQKDANG